MVLCYSHLRKINIFKYKIYWITKLNTIVRRAWNMRSRKWERESCLAWKMVLNSEYDTELCLAAAAAKSLQSCPTLCDPIDGSPSRLPVPGILQARTLEWVAISISNAWKWKVKSESEVTQLCLALSNSMDCSLPGSSVRGIFQARVLEWGAMWDECNCALVWAFFGIAFLWDWNENWPFPVLWPLLSFPNLLAYWVQHFNSIIFQAL